MVRFGTGPIQKEGRGCRGFVIQREEKSDELEGGSEGGGYGRGGSLWYSGARLRTEMWLGFPDWVITRVFLISSPSASHSPLQ